MAQNYRNAMNCRKCPGSNGPDGCPWWWEYAETNAMTNETRITKECGIQALPKFLGHVLAASNRPAAAIESTRDALISTLQGVGQVLDKRVEVAVQKHIAGAAALPAPVVQAMIGTDTK